MVLNLPFIIIFHHLSYLSNEFSFTRIKNRDDSKKIISNAIKLAKLTNTKIFAFHPGYLREADVNEKVISIAQRKQQNFISKGLKFIEMCFLISINLLEIKDGILLRCRKFISKFGWNK